MIDAAEALMAATRPLLSGLTGLAGVHEAAPLQAAFPFVIVETGSETDWSHKSGAGREVRLTLIIRDQGESGARLRRLAHDAERAILGDDMRPTGWNVVTATFLRRRTIREPRSGWSALLEYRVRMLAAPS